MARETGLVLEGGGMRGIYTAGVLDFFLEKKLEFPYVIGVSAGACNAASYLSKQWGRNKQVNIGFVKDRKYMSYRNLILKGEFFGMDYLFDIIPNQIVPFDYDAFKQNEAEFVVGTTDCHTGEPVYFSRKDYQENLLTPIRASSSLPFMAPIVTYKERHLLDGGMSDPIPVKKAERDGYEKNVIILTRNHGYRKTSSRFHFLARKKYARYPGILKVLENQWKVYNETMDYVEKLEEENRAFVIRPTEQLKVSRIERNQKRLSTLYEQGYQDAKQSYSAIGDWLTNV
ncbi:putative patatin/cPLA2 family phospholipase [Bacillus ectoiniformans]|uniref:patatin-like phospholipase family protein n=1 Tax=Bacillus ectoiniformans TaxID=1494429 RepID=UPI0019560656|nr:patatin family protein [Bacillus ectoiniformans]MBM7647875.1 putative patatin/cPLA2 family phospholipase [Bacillus ectoiniformans]